MSSKKSKNYFTQETEDAIVKYNNTEDSDKKAKIFSDHIYFPFYKLAENIIHTFKFYYMDVDDVEDLKHKIITVLLEDKIHKYDPSLGYKAFSYFSVIVKRWLINYNNKNYKKLKRRGTLDEFDNDRIEPEPYMEEGSMDLDEFFDFYIEQMYLEIDDLFRKERDKAIADAVLSVFEVREDLEVFKKKALYIYIKEIVDCKTAHLTKVVKVLKKRFYEILSEHQEVGMVHRFS